PAPASTASSVLAKRCFMVSTQEPMTSRHWLGPPLEAFEAHELTEETQRDLAGRTVALFGEDDLRQPAGLFRRLVVVLAVEQHDHVGVLLDGARLAEIAHARPIVVAALDVAVELGQSDHRQLQLSGDGLERARDRRDLLLPALHSAARAQQLQVID